MSEWRCSCGRLLGMVALVKGSVQVKCGKCGKVNTRTE